MYFEVERFFETKGTCQYDVTKRQNYALNWLSTRDDVLIKGADKGGAACVWIEDKYITEAK